MSYNNLVKMDASKLSDKSVLLIGAGAMAKQYAKALYAMKINNVTIISMTGEKTKQLSNEFSFKSLSGGFEKNLPNLSKKDLVIIATPIHLLLPATEIAVEYDQTNILIEKPASLYTDRLLLMLQKVKDQRIRVGYNRLVYPNFLLLKELVEKDGGITSCNFAITEWIHNINFNKDLPETYSRWGIANTSHVISMVTDLIGMPKEISSYQYGSLEWHPTGSIFVGSGISKKNIPFSYHGDWKSNGRWGIEIMTSKNVYRLMPLEELHILHKGTTNWESVQFQKAFPDVKQGISEEIAIMLSDTIRKNIDLPTLEQAAQVNNFAERIFGYSIHARKN